MGFDPIEVSRWCGGQWIPHPPGVISAVVHDTKAVSPGALFVAIRGTKFDGHDFVAKAAMAGASAALISRVRAPGLQGLGLPLLVVEDSAQALKALATGYRLKLGLAVVGVTGSTGKTTVKDMISCLLADVIPTACTKGNWNNEIGLPLSILAIPRETRVAVLELGISHPGEMAPLCATARPDWGVITNAGPVHLEFFPSVEAIAQEKGELFRSLPPNGTAVLSLDDPYVNILRDCAHGRVITTSIKGNRDADYQLLLDDRQTGECAVEDGPGGGAYAFRVSQPGAHNRHNALLAIAVARGFGISWEQIASSFERYVPAPMRWEQIQAGGVTLINDAYNANPISMLAAIQTFKELVVPGRKWLVLGDMLELGPSGVAEHLAVGRALVGVSWAGVVTVGVLGAFIARGALDAGIPTGCVYPCDTVESAIEIMSNCIARGDALLVKASRGKHLEEVVLRLSARLGKD